LTPAELQFDAQGTELDASIDAAQVEARISASNPRHDINFRATNH
jgi:hypothetical protein